MPTKQSGYPPFGEMLRCKMHDMSGDDNKTTTEVSSTDAPEKTGNVTTPARTGIAAVFGSKNSDLKPDKFSTETANKSFKSWAKGMMEYVNMIDPQTQANKFIKNLGKDVETGLDVFK